MKTTKKTVYEIVTEQILDQLESGTIPWRKPWNTLGLPTNAISGKAYQGINLLLLGFQSFPTPYWVTFKQAKSLGGSVRKGEKSSVVTFWKLLETVEDGQKKKMPILRYYRVFNVAQCDGIKLPSHAQPVESTDIIPLAAADAIVEGWSDCPSIAHGGAQAYYRPSTDAIQMPPQADFISSGSYYSTLFHEMTHSTGHSARLNRGLDSNPQPFGSADYSKEELVAEFGAAFLCAHAGIDQSQIQNHAAYIQGWVRKLKEQPKLLIQASGQATKAAKFIMGELSSEKGGI
jgi:antirestriction protein ArdC